MAEVLGKPLSLPLPPSPCLNLGAAWVLGLDVWEPF